MTLILPCGYAVGVTWLIDKLVTQGEFNYAKPDIHFYQPLIKINIKEKPK